MSLTNWIFAALMLIVPPERATKAYGVGETAEQRTERYKAIAEQVAQVIDSEGPLFGGKHGKEMSAALVMSIMKHESAFLLSVDNGTRRGDGGRSVCMMQVLVGKGTVPWGSEEMQTWTAKDLIEDRTKCIRAGYTRLRMSLGECRGRKDGDRLSSYTSGHCQDNHGKAWTRWNTMAYIFNQMQVKR